MVTVASLWMAIVLSAVLVFIASSILHMALRFWHNSELSGFSNEDEVAAAIRKGNAGAGMYMIPHCVPEKMREPGMREKFISGPVGAVFLRTPGPIQMGPMLGQWFGYCLLVCLFAAYVSSAALPAGAGYLHVFRVAGSAAFMGFALGMIPNSIWWGHPWSSTFKNIVDGLLYALLTAGVFGWLWPRI